MYWLICAAAISTTAVSGAAAVPPEAVVAVRALLKRVAPPTTSPTLLSKFNFALIDGAASCTGKTQLCFSYEAGATGTYTIKLDKHRRKL